MQNSNSLTISEFAQKIIDSIKAKNPNVNPNIVKVPKPGNIICTGINFDNGTSVRPVIYIDDAYSAYTNGRLGLDSAVNEILTTYAECTNAAGSKATADMNSVIDSISDWAKTKPRVRAKLINADWNSGYMSDKVSIALEGCNLSKVFYIDIPTPTPNTNGTVCITNDMAAAWGVTAKDLDNTAKDNSLANPDKSIMSMSDTYASLLTGNRTPNRPSNKEDLINSLKTSVRQNGPLLVVTSENKVFGAINVLDEETDDILKSVLGEYYILPSSVHECIIVPRDGMNLDHLRDMVSQINEAEVAPADRLSDDIFIYDNGSLRIAV